MVKVKPTDTKNKITVKTSTDINVYSIKDNLSEYYAKQAEKWAHSEGIVNGIDYSSKYYAEQSKASVQIAEGIKTETQELVEDFDNEVQVAKNNLEQSRIDSINAINSTYLYTIEDIQNKSEQAFIEIENKATEVSNQIKQDNSEASKLAKDWATSEVLVDNIDYSAKYYAGKANESALNAQSFAQSALETLNSVESKVQETTNVAKEEIQEISATEQAELEEIKEGIINYAGIYYEEIADEDIDVDILEQGYVSDVELKEALDTKQDKGDYALKEEIPSLEGYVKNTEYATQTTAGVVKSNTGAGVGVNPTGQLSITKATDNDIQNKEGIYKPLVASRIDLIVKTGVTTNTYTLTEDEKASAKQWLGFADGTDIMQAIASIPQFKLSIVEELPLAGEKMTLYLVSKGTESPDVYDEYIWIEETSSFEFLGTTAVDLNDYVKKTDFAKSGSAGIINVAGSYGTTASASGYLRAVPKNLTEYNESQDYLFVAKGTLENIKDDYIKRGVTENSIELTAEEQANARTWLGAIGSTDYATTKKAGIIRAVYADGVQTSGGRLIGVPRTLESWVKQTEYHIVCKGTLDNVLTQYSKTVSLTQADYDALETVDETTLYLIEE